VLALATVGLILPAAPAAAADPCAAPVNVIACENTKAGTPQSVWDIDGAGDEGLQGFASSMSVNVGSKVDFKIKTTARSYTIDLYRLGWYGGDGARRVASVSPSAVLPQTQPACIDDQTTGLYDCGTWKVSASWNVPSTAVSGIYIAKLTNPANGDESHITFVVRNDASTSNILFQTSDTTWQAYNDYGGQNFYWGTGGRATKLSYNRPFATRMGTTARDFLFSNEFPMLQFLERNGYDVSYASGIDTDRRGALIKNHKVFLSVGHDEYWSGQARANVEAARDAGVNLAFFSGNEVYWKTRLAPSVDGSSSADRTLVCYKETWDNAKTDPTNQWTGTWRDPRFSPPADGGRPENALTGTAYMSNDTDLAVTVSDVEGKFRLWRNTSLSSMPSGQPTALAPHTVGYESDEDLDNGFRPAGLIRLSTTTGSTPQYLRDFGSTVTPGTTTHHLTMYKAGSGALVFGAGTIQWAWGLSQNHDGDGAPADVRMQQATVNILADMKAQPTTLMSGLSAATASADTQAPTVTITSPSSGATVANGATVTVTGTASDLAGRVAGVEVSTDGGASWHAATGYASWTYTYTQQGSGAASVKARAVDDSANLGAAQTLPLVAKCPCSLFGSQVPVTSAANDASGVELGVRFKATIDGYINGVRFYKGVGNSGTHTGTVWSASGIALSTGTFANETATGWQTLQLASPVEVTAGTVYVASYFAPNGHYAADPNVFAGSDYKAPPLTAPGRPSNSLNGVYQGGHRYPDQSFNDTNYWVDVLFTTTNESPPVVSTQVPLSGSSSISATVTPSAKFSMPVDPSTVAFSLRDSTGAAIAGSTNYDATTRTATFNPSTNLVRGATYTARALATSAAGVPMATASVWSFTTAKPTPPPGICPCSIWDDATTPSTVNYDENKSLELGVRFTADVDGQVRGVRFFKGPLNAGPHLGSWGSTPAPLRTTATFSGESTSGWQTVTFSTPVAITAGTTYVASYRAPQGYYATDNGGLASAVNAEPLHTLANGGAYTYGTGYPSNSSNTNYWVDVVFTATDAAPAVASTSPSDGATSVNTGATVTATFAATIQSGSAQLVVRTADNSAVPGSATYSAVNRTITFTPTAALAEGATFTATVLGAKALSGAQMSPFSWTFRTVGLAACPCSLFDTSARPAVVDSGDNSSVELGVRFVPQVDGRVTGVRFYKSDANTGIHVGTLWSDSGTRLASVTFSGESASGWQSASFSTSVKVSAGTTYVVSYLAPKGRYSVSAGFFGSKWTNGPMEAPGGANGVYQYGPGGFPNGSYGSSNYWVDALFVPLPPTGAEPEVTGGTPIPDATSVAASVTPSATFAAAIDSASLTFGLKDSSGVSVSGATTYDAVSRTAVFSPVSALQRGVKYTASVKASSPTGATMSDSYSWSFVTAKPSPTAGICPCGIWDDATTPTTVTVNDSGNVELGVKFSADVNGQVSGIRFYKGPENTGTHTGTLWTSAGELLATATFTGESSTGWQTVTFSSPVSVIAGVTYVASYRAPVGRYAADSGGLSTPIDSGPLHTQAGGAVYTYGPGFPSNASNANYWVDVVFAATS